MEHNYWYQKLGYKENPLSIKPTERIIGQEQVLNALFYKIDSSSMAILEGEMGSGKTSMLKHLIKRYGGKKKVVHAYCNRITDYDMLVPQRKGLGKLLPRKKGFIVLLDEADHITAEGLETIKQLFDDGIIKSVVFSGTRALKVMQNKSVAERLGTGRIPLTPLKIEEAVEMISSRMGSRSVLSSEVIKKVYLNSRNPRKLLHACEGLCRKAFDKKSGELVDDVRKRLETRLNEGTGVRLLRYLGSD
ncbi:MAG: AAA family ATPase [archaeon]